MRQCEHCGEPLAMYDQRCPACGQPCAPTASRVLATLAPATERTPDPTRRRRSVRDPKPLVIGLILVIVVVGGLVAGALAINSHIDPREPTNAESTALCNDGTPIHRMKAFVPGNTNQAGVVRVAPEFYTPGAQPFAPLHRAHNFNVVTGSSDGYSSSQPLVWMACVRPVHRPLRQTCTYVNPTHNETIDSQQDIQQTWLIEMRELRTGKVLDLRQVTVDNQGADMAPVPGQQDDQFGQSVCAPHLHFTKAMIQPDPFRVAAGTWENAAAAHVETIAAEVYHRLTNGG